MQNILVPISESEVVRNKLTASKTLWRYLTGEKFCHLLEERAFWFSRIDQFIGDPSEGIRPEVSELSDSEQNFFIAHGVVKWEEQYPGATEQQKTGYFALCWHINHRENGRMWREYTGECFDSVAIVTSHKAIQMWLLESRRQLRAAPVKYCRETAPRPAWRYEDTFFYKDLKKFGHEKEFRVLTQWADNEIPSPPLHTLEARRRIVPFNCRRDIHRIIFHPKASQHFKEEIRQKAKTVFPRLKRIEDSALIKVW